MLQFHYCLDKRGAVFGEISAQAQYSDSDFNGAYLWLQKEIGFYPLFVAVERKLKQSEAYKIAGQFPNRIIFSFDALDGIFMDYPSWHIVLNASWKNYRVSEYEKRLIFKPSWPRSRWLQYAQKNPRSVQLVLPKIDLRFAKKVWACNHRTKMKLINMGFRKVEVRCIFVS